MRHRVLVIAEAANPDWVSVPLIGWSLARALAEVADVHLVTQVRNRAAIEAAGLVEGVDFTAIDSEALARPLWALGGMLRMGEGKGWTALQAVSAISYPYFERLVWKRFGADIRKHKYDVVHRITPLSPTQTGPLAAQCGRAGVPYVIGPLNGGVPWPREFEAARRAEREWLSYVRGIYRLLPGRKSMLNATSCILAGSRHTATEYGRWSDRTIWLPENGIDPNRFPDQTRPPVSGPLRACFIGRMVPYKGPDMLLEAASDLLRSGRMTLDLVGDGPMMEDIRKRAAPFGAAVRLHGWLPHDQVQSVAGQCSLLAFPSVREFGGGVVLEAMAMGLAPLIVDYAGPGELVTDRTGYKVALGDRDAIVSRFRAALDRLAEDPADVAARGARARAVARQNFTWAAKARQVSEVYDWVTGEQEIRPDFAGLNVHVEGRYSDVAG